MAVKNSVLENIWSSLENLQEYVVSNKIGKVDRKVLSMIESDLLNLECRLKLFTDYKPVRRSK
jgi:hypothetical protein